MNEYVVSVNGEKIKINFSGDSKVNAGEREYVYELLHLEGNRYLLKLDNRIIELSSKSLKDGNYEVLINDKVFETAVHTALQDKAAVMLQQKSGKRHITEIKAPMPGMILKIKKNLKDKITQGETVLILEAMKMENDLRAPHSGIIKDIFVNEGNAIEKGTILYTIE